MDSNIKKKAKERSILTFDAGCRALFALHNPPRITRGRVIKKRCISYKHTRVHVSTGVYVCRYIY